MCWVFLECNERRNPVVRPSIGFGNAVFFFGCFVWRDGMLSSVVGAKNPYYNLHFGRRLNGCQHRNSHRHVLRKRGWALHTSKKFCECNKQSNQLLSKLGTSKPSRAVSCALNRRHSLWILNTSRTESPI